MLKRQWSADYKGHRIRVENTLFTEKLFIDDQLVAESSGIKATAKLRAPVPGQKGSDEEVIAFLHQGGFGVQCTIFIGKELGTSG